MDKKWFRNRLEDRSLSDTKAAGIIGMDKTAFSRLLAGKRRLTTDEAGRLADLLGEPLGEVLRRAGVAVPTDPRGQVPIVGIANGGGRIGPLGAGGPRRAIRAPELAEDAQAVRVKAPGGFCDGWLCYFVASRQVSLEAVGRLSVVELGNKAGRVLGVLTRGYESGKWSVRGIAGGGVEDVAIECAAPVVWVRC